MQTTTSLRKVGGSIMMTLPRTFLDQLQIDVGSRVGISIHDAHIIITPQKKPQYSLDELLAQCDTTAKATPEEKQWLESPATGKEVL